MSRNRSEFNLYTRLPQVIQHPGYPPRPDEAEVAATWRHRNPSYRMRIDAWAVHVEPHFAELVHPAFAAGDDIGAHYVTIEGIGPLPVTHVDDAVVQFDSWLAHLTAPNVRPLTRYFWMTQVNAMMGAIIAMVAAQIEPI